MKRLTSYPSCRYHPEKGVVTVRDEFDDEARAPAADGWVHSPADFKPKPAGPEVVSEAVTEEAESVTESVTEPVIEAAELPAPVRRRGKGKKSKQGKATEEGY